MKKFYRKRNEVEQRIGKTVSKYVIEQSKQGVTQEEMAAELGVSVPTLRRWIDEDGLEYAPAYRKRS